MTRTARYYAAFSLGRNETRKLRYALRNVRHLVDVPAMLVTKLYRCHEDLDTLSEQDFTSCLRLIESFVMRRVICGLQTRGYWSVFAGIAHALDEANPLQSLKVSFARLSNYLKIRCENA